MPSTTSKLRSLFFLVSLLSAIRPAYSAQEGFINQVCAGPGPGSVFPFDALPFAQRDECQALLNDLVASRGKGDTESFGQYLVQNEGASKKMVNNVAGFAFGSQISGRAAGGSAECVLELIKENDGDLENGVEQIGISVVEAITFMEDALACAGSDGNMAAMATVQRTETETGETVQQFMVYVSGRTLLTESASDLDPSLQAALPFGQTQATDELQRPNQIISSFDVKMMARTAPTHVPHADFPGKTALTRRALTQCPATQGLRRGAVGSLIINFIEGTPAISRAIREVVDSDFVEGQLFLLQSMFIQSQGNANPLMRTTTTAANPLQVLRSDAFWTIGMQLFTSQTITRWSDVAALAGGAQTLGTALRESIPADAAGLQLAFYELVDATTGLVVANIHVLASSLA